MSSEQPPITCKELKAILSSLGFAFSTKEGSHEQWVLIKDGKKYKVTVDCPKAPFSQFLIKSMASQAGKSKKDFYKIDQFFSYNKDKKWQIRISGATSSVAEFSVGDKVTISNIVAIDINDERKLLKNYYTVIEATKNYISVEFESDFPLRRVEMDSDEHRIGVTKNIWLSGIFLNGYFKGIWNNGVFSGYPLITKMDESHWIDGVFNGGHFTAKKYSVKFDNIGNVSYNVDNSKRLGLTFSTPHKLNDNDSIVIYDDKENLVGSTIVLSVIDEMNLITGLTWETVSNFNNLRRKIIRL